MARTLWHKDRVADHCCNFPTENKFSNILRRSNHPHSVAVLLVVFLNVLQASSNEEPEFMYLDKMALLTDVTAPRECTKRDYNRDLQHHTCITSRPLKQRCSCRCDVSGSCSFWPVSGCAPQLQTHCTPEVIKLGALGPILCACLETGAVSRCLDFFHIKPSFGKKLQLLYVQHRLRRLWRGTFLIFCHISKCFLKSQSCVCLDLETLLLSAQIKLATWTGIQVNKVCSYIEPNCIICP